MTVGKELYYRSAILFTDRIADLATVKPAALVRANINTYLRGAALSWYMSELNDAERSGLRNNTDGINLWIKSLKRRFKVPTTVALQQLTTTKYTINDVRNRNEPAEYVQSMLRHAKAAGFDTTHNQLSWAYQNLAPALRLNIDPPNEYTFIEKFVRILELKKEAWFDMYSRQYQPEPKEMRSSKRPSHNYDNNYGSKFKENYSMSRPQPQSQYQSQSNSQSNQPKYGRYYDSNNNFIGNLHGNSTSLRPNQIQSQS